MFRSWRRPERDLSEYQVAYAAGGRRISYVYQDGYGEGAEVDLSADPIDRSRFTDIATDIEDEDAYRARVDDTLALIFKLLVHVGLGRPDSEMRRRECRDLAALFTLINFAAEPCPLVLRPTHRAYPISLRNPEKDRSLGQSIRRWTYSLGEKVIDNLFPAKNYVSQSNDLFQEIEFGFGEEDHGAECVIKSPAHVMYFSISGFGSGKGKEGSKPAIRSEVNRAARHGANALFLMLTALVPNPLDDDGKPTNGIPNSVKDLIRARVQSFGTEDAKRYLKTGLGVSRNTLSKRERETREEIRRVVFQIINRTQWQIERDPTTCPYCLARKELLEDRQHFNSTLKKLEDLAATPF